MPADPQLPQEDGRRWTIRVCPVCGNEMGRSTGCLGTIQQQHAPSGAVLIEVVPASQVAALRDEVKHLTEQLRVADSNLDEATRLWQAEVARLAARVEAKNRLIGAQVLELSKHGERVAHACGEAVEQERRRLTDALMDAGRIAAVKRARELEPSTANRMATPDALTLGDELIRAALAAVLEEEGRDDGR